MVVVAFFGALCLADGTFALGVLVMGCIGLTSSGSWQLTSPLLSGSLSFIATLNDISVSSINTVEHSSKYKDNTVTWSRWYRHINFNVATKLSHFIQIQLLCTLHYCPACRTSLIATRFWVVMICPIIKCLTVLRVFFYFVWFVFIHHNFILNYVPTVTFWIFTYHKIWILLIIFCFIWNYWIIYFLTYLEVFWSVVG